MFRQPRKHDPRHLRFIRQLPCIVCGASMRIHAAHVRHGAVEYDKRPTGMSEKPGDRWAVPLCADHHLEGAEAQHSSNERDWWEARSIDPLAAAEELYAISGDRDAGRAIVINYALGASTPRRVI